MPVEVTISLPDVPEGRNPFEYYRWFIRGLLNPTATKGFEARLDVLFAFMGYGLVISMLYLGAMFIEFRRRKKRFWLYRLVTRPNGTYIIGNQHALFAICSIISCGILIGYTFNARRVVLLLMYQQRAFFWRTLVWVPLILHAWISSWANLQAAILSGQKLTNQHHLSPRFANGFYIGGLLCLLIPILVLDVFSGFSWRHVWEKALALKAILIANAASSPNLPQDQAADIVAAPLAALNDQLRYFGKTQRAVTALYVFAMVVVIGVNIAGLGLLFTLRKQIKYNSRRLSTQRRTSTLPGRSSIVPSPPTLPPPVAKSYFPKSTSPAPQLLSPVPEDVMPAPRTLIRKVLFASTGRNSNPDYDDDKMTVSQLKDAASNKAPANAAQRDQAKQLLALKKIEWDLFVFLAAIIILAACFLALALWLCIKPSSVYSSWAAMETAFFLVPWLYLIGVNTSLSFLLFNSVRHLLSANSRFHRGRLANVVGVGGRPGTIRRESFSGLTWSEDLTSDTTSRPSPPGVVVERQVVVEMEELDAGQESPGGTTRR
ncbi:hypothetical protein JCM11641_001987 [Rhodosporidiobolus odoratus]